MVDKILLVIGLLVAAAIIITGGFGLLQGDFIGFDLFGPRACSPGGWFSGYSAEPPPTDGQIISSGASPTGPAAQPGYSPYEKRVRIQTVVRPSSSSLKPEEEYAFLRNADDSSKPPIVISGWTLENSQGKRYAIAGAQKLALMDVNETSVFLPPGAEAYVHTGPSPINVSFRENACTGYLNENNKFMPRLAERCPRPDVSKFIRFTDRCLDFMERSIYTCRVPKIDETAAGIEYECGEFIDKHFKYSGCVDDFRAASDFYKNTWQLYLGRPEKLWRSLHDLIILRDSQGLIVDTYQY
ncbi:MAG: hypothetical protein UY71_C0004G0011 [Parcubacteria group bacterium GW2011_GWB1_52_7]|nr:MAG: hypothetical protein UY71_C0004G0011 [Parcubacteria group bacterium GW2011_GWB1_52_7]